MDFDVEQIILGSIILENNAFTEVYDVIGDKHEVFINQKHQDIYKLICDIKQENKPIDILILVEELKKQQLLNKIGGASYVAKLTTAINSTENLTTHTHILVETYLRQRLQQIANKIKKYSKNKEYDIFSLTKKITDVLNKEIEFFLKKGYTNIQTLLPSWYKEVEEGKQCGIATGYNKLDKIIGGLVPKALIVIVARTSVGKTLLGLNISTNIALRNINVGFISMEMGANALISRIMSNICNIKHYKIRNTLFTKQEFNQLKIEKEKEWTKHIFIEEKSNMTIKYMRSVIEKMVYKNDIKIITVDYIGLVRQEKEDKKISTQQHITDVSNELQTLANELNITIIALAQTNRESVYRVGSPDLSHIRDSGAIEQDATTVLYIDVSKHTDDVNKEDEFKIHILKNRHGTTGIIELEDERKYMRFVEKDEAIEDTPF